MIDAAELLQRIDQMSPACREPQVFMDRPHCNCMVGIHGVREIVIAMTEKGNDATIEYGA